MDSFLHKEINIALDKSDMRKAISSFPNQINESFHIIKRMEKIVMEIV